MKYLVGLVVGMLTGCAIFAAALYWNPFAGRNVVSPLAVASGHLLEVRYSLVPHDGIAYVNDGQSRTTPHPAKVQQLWEPAVRDTTVRVTVLEDRGKPAGIGIKFSTGSADSRLMDAKVLVDSVWHIWLAGRGGMMVHETENRWQWLRDIVIPAYRHYGDGWRGSWYGVVTAGPGALGSGILHGGSGEFRGVTGEAVEAIQASAYSAQSGPVDASGSLTLSLPAADTARQAISGGPPAGEP